MLQLIAEHAADIAAILSCAAWFIRPVREWLLDAKNTREEQERTREGQRCLLRAEIVRIYYRNNAACKLKEYEFRNLEACYKAYKALEGNSFIDHIYSEMQKWDIEQ